MAARLEVEIGGINTELKKTLRDSVTGLTEFSKSVSNIKPNSVVKINDTLRVTKTLLADISKMAVAAGTALSGLNKGDLRASITSQRIATAEARAETERLRAESVRLRNELTAQKIEQQRSASAIDASRLAAQNYRTEAARLSAELAALRLQSSQNRQSIVAASGSYREAQQRLTALGKAIREAENGFRSANPAIQAQIREYRNLNRQLQDFDSTMGNNQRRVGAYQRAFNGIGGVIAGAFGVTAVIAAGRAVVNTNAEISDSLADVRRTAGLTAKEADVLSESLKRIDTRTNLKDLLGISIIGGQLGIAKDQLDGFTEAIDQLAVTLSGELQGGAEGIAKSLGVLDNVFQVTSDNAGDVNASYNKIGSAILSLGQSGLATGEFLADFGERVGGLAKQAGISLPVILSYGAVLQENGVSAEVAGTSFKRLLSALSTNSGGFFAVAKMADANLTLKEFNTIVNTDTKKALDLFFAGLQKGGTSTIAFNSILKTLKLSQAGVSQSIAALSNNLPELDKHIQQTTKDFNDGTISADQFAIKNDNLAASIDKLGNAFTNAVSKGSVSTFFKTITDGLTNVIIKFDKFVNSSSWKEFRSRFAELVNFTGGDAFDTNKTISGLIKRTADNQKFLYPQGGSPEQQSQKLQNLGQQGFNNYLSNLKKTADESGKALQKLQKDIKSGRLVDNGALKDIEETARRSKTYYEDVYALQKKLGFAAKPAAARSNAETPEGFEVGGKKTKKDVFSLAEVMEQLRKAIELTGVQFQSTFDDRNNGKIAAYQSAINAVTNALGAQSSVVKNLQKEQQKLFQLTPIKPISAVDPSAQKALNKAASEITITGKREVPDLFNKEAAEIAKNAKRELNRAVLDFGTNFYRTLTTINQLADRSFIGVVGVIGENITGMLQDTFGTQLSGILQRFTEEGKIRFKNLGEGLSAAAGVIGGLLSGITKKTNTIGQTAGGALTGAASGALAGSAIPGIGTAVGAVVGGLFGALSGLLGSGKARKEERDLQLKQLEETKKQTELMRQNATAYTSAILGRMTDQGILTNVEVGSFGQLKAVVNGKQIDFILDRTNNSR